MTLNTMRNRIAALEASKVAGLVAVRLRLISRQGDSDEVVKQRMAEARAAYVAENGEPCGGFMFLHRVLVSGAAHLNDARGHAESNELVARSACTVGALT
jgi:hypothetical protein